MLTEIQLFGEQKDLWAHRQSWWGRLWGWPLCLQGEGQEMNSLQPWYPHFNGNFTTRAWEREGCLHWWGCYCLGVWHKIMGVFALRLFVDILLLCWFSMCVTVESEMTQSQIRRQRAKADRLFIQSSHFYALVHYRWT